MEANARHLPTMRRFEKIKMHLNRGIDGYSLTVTLSGKIIMVDTAKRIVVVRDANGVPIDMIVTPSTRIKSGEQRLKVTDLASETNQSASVKFVPERLGDVAQSIRVTG